MEELQNLPELSLGYEAGRNGGVNGSVENIRGDTGIYQEVYTSDKWVYNERPLLVKGIWTLTFGEPVFINTLIFRMQLYTSGANYRDTYYSLQCRYNNSVLYTDSKTNLPQSNDISYNKTLGLIINQIIITLQSSHVTYASPRSCYVRLGEIRIIGKQIYQDKIRFADKNGTVWVPFVDSESNSILRIFDGKVIQKIMLANKYDYTSTPFRVQNGQYIMGTEL
jgi:hypothetical protein